MENSSEGSLTCPCGIVVLLLLITGIFGVQEELSGLIYFSHFYLAAIQKLSVAYLELKTPVNMHPVTTIKTIDHYPPK